ncbi:hypothetical protein M422DRAFT_160832 [Sphaerobolus stellatus SS14]|nr:hypothetical protein M422DRAFT_160832 [Sphaerobolus stellatus SS14]
MAAPWVTQRRPQSSTPSLQIRPPISVEDWEARSPLGDLEVRTVNVLKGACEERKLPLKFSAEEPFSRPTTPLPKGGITRVSNALSSPSRPSSPVARTDATAGPSRRLHPKHPIQTPEQFHDWFAQVERSVAHSQEAHFRTHLENVSSRREGCEKLLEAVDRIESEVDDMIGEWRSVEEGGRSLKDACERLLQEKDRLMDLTDAISLRLEYFQELEHATRMLNHPGESLVLQSDFLLMVERVDVCIEFLQSHREFREAEIYLLRFQQCLTRAMTLIRMFFIGSLKALAADIYRRTVDKEISDTAHMHLLYSKFLTASYQVAPLLAELERRAELHPDEISSLLTECHTAYLSTRKSLLTARLIEDIKGLDPAHSELVELTRSGCTYMRQLCMDEFDLYRRFFSTGEDRLYHYLESLCDYLFDDLRPRILHEPRLTTLCEVCTVLQALMIVNLPPSSFSDITDFPAGTDSHNDINADADSESEFYLQQQEPQSNGGKGLAKLHIQPLLQLVLQDAQTRLLFKAQAVMESEIRVYKAKAEDLAYPDKLIGKGPKSGLELTERDPHPPKLFNLPSAEEQATWYPTLRRTVWVLSQIHEFVHLNVFEDIAHEAIGLCRYSLKNAAEDISTKQPPESRFDGLLFLVRHLLILKDMTVSLALKDRAAFERAPGMCFCSFELDALASVIRGTSAFLGTTGLFGAARGDELDVLSAIDNDLKEACEELINRRSEAATKPLHEFLDRCTAFRSGKPPPTSTSPDQTISTSLAEQPFATPSEVAQVDLDFHAACDKETRAWMAQLRIYLKDQKTISVLLAPYQTRIVTAYTSFRDLVTKEYPNEVGGKLVSSTDLWGLLQRLCN